MASPIHSAARTEHVNVNKHKPGSTLARRVMIVRPGSGERNALLAVRATFEVLAIAIRESAAVS